MYETLKMLHILSVIMLTSGSILGVTVSSITKTAKGTQQLAMLAQFARRVPMLTMPGAILAMITGSLLVWRMGFGFTTPWVIAAYVTWTLAMVLSGAVLARKMKSAVPLLQKALASGAADAPEFQQALLDPTFRITQHFVTSLMLVFIYLMVFKPGLH